MKRGVLAVLASAAVIILSNASVCAAQQAAHNGLMVSPAIEQLTLNPGQDTASFVAQVSNDSAVAMTIEARVDDFTALNTGGSVQFLNNNSLTASPHGLAHWMTPGVALFNLEIGRAHV